MCSSDLGAQAGAMSPLAPPGIISANILAKVGLTGVGGYLWLNMLIVHVVATVIAYLMFGGIQLWRTKTPEHAVEAVAPPVEPFSRGQLATLGGIALLIGVVVVFKIDLGLGAFIIGSMLVLFKAADENKAIKSMPWNTILMVTGVTVLVNLMTDVGGMELFAKLIATMSTTGTVTLVAGSWAGHAKRSPCRPVCGVGSRLY